MSDDKAVSRRWVLVGIGVLLNGAVALLIATPVVGYLLGPIRKNGGYDSWIDLGDISQFPVGETRLASFVNPAEHALGRRHREGGLLGSPDAGPEVPGVSPSTVPTLVARCAGFPSRNCSCAPAMAGSITAMARVLPGPHREAFSNIPTRCKTAN